MKKILLCSGEENQFDKKMTMLKMDDNNYSIDYIKLFLSDRKRDKIKQNLGNLFIEKQINPVLKETLDKYECVIFFDCAVKNYAINYIRKNNPKLRIIIYFRNLLKFSKKRNLNIEFLKKRNCEFWSYNIYDCQKYDFKYNSQFWNTNFMSKLHNHEEIKYDIAFLGRVKNRENEILELKSICEKFSLRDYIYLVPKSKFEFDRNVSNEYMNYLEYLKMIQESNVIVDLVNKDNLGLTVRPLEAIFLNKKLITNYKDIIKYDFYNKNNVFIIGVDNCEKINEFINTPYVEIDRKIVEKYDYKNWIKNFFRG